MKSRRSPTRYRIHGPGAGIIQVTANTADATIYGFAGDASYAIPPQLTINGNFGYLLGKIDKLNRAVSPTGVIIPDQYDLKIPYLSPWPHDVSAEYCMNIGSDEIAIRTSYNRNDAAFGDDLNTGVLNPVDNVDGNLARTTVSGKLGISVYGKNLLDKVTYGLQFALPYEPNLLVAPLA